MKKTTKHLRTIKRIPDGMRLDMAPMLGEEKKPGTRGRPPVPFRKVMDGIFYVPPHRLPVEGASKGVWLGLDSP